MLQIATTAVYGIITQQSTQSSATTPIKFQDENSQPTTIKVQETSPPTPVKFKEFPPPRHARKINNKSLNWKTVLKDAAFQSLIKHTAFTPSLEEKMESDRLLWEKLQSAKFYRKNNGKSDDGNEQVKMGVLLDMTSEAGNLEFRQSDRSVYTCPDSKCDDILKRLLAIWKIEKFEPNDTWIRIKVPRHGKEEDVYEYTPKHGLQMMSGRFSPVTKNVTKSSPTEDPTYTEDETSPTTEPIIDERIARIERRMDFDTTSPRKMSIYEVKHARPKDLAGSKGKIEFTGKYDPYVTRKLVSQPIRFTNMNKKNILYKIKPADPSFVKVEPNVLREFQIGNVYDGFIPSMGPTGSPYTTTMNYNRQFSQNFPKFTEYETKINHDTVKRVNFKSSPKFNQYSELDPIYHEQAYVPQEITLPKGLKEIVKNATLLEKARPVPAKNMTKIKPQHVHTELTDSSINVSRFADAKGNSILLTTKPPPRKEKKPKNGLTSIFRPSSEEAHDYAPLYVKWGEKLTTPKSEEVTATGIPVTSQDAETTTDDEQTSTQKTNMFIENISEKSPEEIVNTLTTIGVVNMTRVEGYPPVSEKTLETSTRILKKMTAGKDSKSSHTDPISLIVNRISQSYSYRTAKGKVKNFKKMRRNS